MADRFYRDNDGGGYFFTADDADALIVRTKTAIDNATPSGNGTMVGVLARLWHLTGDTGVPGKCRRDRGRLRRGRRDGTPPATRS